MSSQEEELDECDTECWSYDDAEYHEIAQPEDAEPVVADPPLLTSSTDLVSDVSVISDDPAEWIPDDELRERLASRPIKQNIGDFSRSERAGKTQKRYLPPSLFHRQMANGELVKREWLVYSPSTGNVFCQPCMLFSAQQSVFRTGFCDWKNCHSRVVEHEKSADHTASVTARMTRVIMAGRVDCTLVKQLKDENNYWREVLRRVVKTVKFLAERGLPFRGTDEKFGSQTNGNYLGIMELIAKFNSFLCEHIKRYGGAGHGVTSYLSKTTCEEFIQLLARKVEASITAEIKLAKYFSISVNSTPDLANFDHLTFIIRYDDTCCQVASQ